MAEFPNKRRHIRYQPDPLDVALLMQDDGQDGPFVATDVGLILDESAMAGAQVVLRQSPWLVPGVSLRIQIGRLSPLKATIVWIRPVDQDLIRAGVKLSE